METADNNFSPEADRDNNFSPEADRDLLLESKLMFLDLENHLGPFSQLSDEAKHQ